MRAAWRTLRLAAAAVLLAAATGPVAAVDLVAERKRFVEQFCSRGEPVDVAAVEAFLDQSRVKAHFFAQPEMGRDCPDLLIAVMERVLRGAPSETRVEDVILVFAAVDVRTAGGTPLSHDLLRWLVAHPRFPVLLEGDPAPEYTFVNSARFLCGVDDVDATLVSDVLGPMTLWGNRNEHWPANSVEVQFTTFLASLARIGTPCPSVVVDGVRALDGEWRPGRRGT